MADRVLRGSRLGAVSYENERSQEPAARRRATFDCPQGHVFSKTFAEEAELPATWDCPSCGAVGIVRDGPRPGPAKVKPVRTHWDMLLERRSVGELQVLLDERLAELRGTDLAPAAPRKSA